MSAVENIPEENLLLDAGEVARICQMDLKTVHNWCDRGLIPVTSFFRTPGRHLRFYKGPILAWLAAQGYPVTEEMRRKLCAWPSPSAPFVAQAIIDCGELRGGGVSAERVEVLYKLLRRAAEVDASIGAAYDELTEAREKRRAAAEGQVG